MNMEAAAAQCPPEMTSSFAVCLLLFLWEGQPEWEVSVLSLIRSSGSPVASISGCTDHTFCISEGHTHVCKGTSTRAFHVRLPMYLCVHAFEINALFKITWREVTEL